MASGLLAALSAAGLLLAAGLGLGSAGACPPAPPAYTAYPGHCMAEARPGPGNQDCGQWLTINASCAEGLAGCVEQARSNCDADSRCHSFALLVRDCAHAPRPIKWQTLPYGAGGEVPNPDWLAFAKPGPPQPPQPPGKLNPSLTCPFKQAAYRFAMHIQPERAPHLDVFDSLRLHRDCNVTRPPSNTSAGTSRRTTGSPMTTSAGVRLGDAPHAAVFADASRGDDRAGDGSLLRPFQSVGRAVREARRRTPKMVLLRAGTYHQAASGGQLHLGPTDSGLVLAGVAGEDVTMTGGVGVACGGRWAPAVLPNGTTSHAILACPLPANFSALWPNVTEMLVAGRRMVLARYPNANNPYQYQGWQGGMHAADWGQTDVAANTNIQKTGPYLRDSPTFPYFESASGGTTDTWTTRHSYWGVSNHSIGPRGGSTWVQPLGHAWSCPAAGADHPCSRPWARPADAVAWCSIGWGNKAYQYVGRVGANMTFATHTGNQMSRQPDCPSFYVEGAGEELDAPGEFWYDRKANALLFYPNGTAAPDEVLLATMEQVVSVRGTQAKPVVGMRLQGIRFTGTAKTFLSPHESTNAGADWAASRRAAVAIEGAVGVDVEGCEFDTIGGNAILWSNFVRESTVRNCTFAWLGENGVLAMGTDQMGDATDGEHPFNNTIEGNLFRELGVYGKHSGAYAEFVAAAVTIRNNIAFNGPRAALALNDGMGGGSDIHHNLLFEMVRESADHGPINSWDRQAFLTTYAHGAPSVNISEVAIHHNFIIAGNDGSWFPIDHDDGSASYHDSYNFLLFGGHKNYLGHSKTFETNVQVFPDYGANPDTRVSCIDFSSGHGEVYRNNTCYLHGDASHPWCNETQCSLISFRDGCPGSFTNISNPTNRLVQASNNTYYVPQGAVPAAGWWKPGCPIAPLAAVQHEGGELGSRVRTLDVSLADIVAHGEALLYS